MVHGKDVETVPIIDITLWMRRVDRKLIVRRRRPDGTERRWSDGHHLSCSYSMKRESED